MTKNSTTNAAREAGQEQHTPGPWVVSQHPRCNVLIVGPVVRLSDGSPDVAEVVSVQQHDEFGPDLLAEANARLITAPPELLQALQQAQMALAGFVGKGRTPVVINAYCQATAAIAKATGAAQ